MPFSAEEPQNAMSFNELAAEPENQRLRLRSINADESQGIFFVPGGYLLLHRPRGRHDAWQKSNQHLKLAVMNSIVDAYNAWGAVERTPVDRCRAIDSPISAVGGGGGLSAVSTGRGVRRGREILLPPG